MELVEAYVRERYSAPTIVSDDLSVGGADSSEIVDVEVKLEKEDEDGRWFDVRVLCQAGVWIDDGDPYDETNKRLRAFSVTGKVLVSELDGEHLCEMQGGFPETFDYDDLGEDIPHPPEDWTE